MIGGLMKSTSHYALAAAAGLFAGALAISPAKAADLGGDCCADLEERVAELEATTVRKGNRVVSVQLYGQVNKALLIWDDGIDSDAYVVDNDISSTRWGFRGSGQMKPGWTAGYRLEIQTESASSILVSQDEGDLDGNSDTAEFPGDDAGTDISVRRSSLYIESARLGRMTIGKTSIATDDLVYTHLGAENSTPGPFLFGGFRVRTPSTTSGYFAGPNVDEFDNGEPDDDSGDGGGDVTSVADNNADDDDDDYVGSGAASLTWGDLAPDTDIGRRDAIRYDTPSIYGFIFSAGWGENDEWDVAARFRKEWNSVQFVAGVGYHDLGDQDEDEVIEQDRFIASAGIKHTPSGLFLDGTYVRLDTEGYASSTSAVIADALAAGVLSNEEEAEYYWIKGGIEQNITGYGMTSVAVAYGHYEDFGVGFIGNFNLGTTGLGSECAGSDGPGTVAQNCDTTDFTAESEDIVIGSEVDRYTFGIEQNFDSAALEIYGIFNYLEADSVRFYQIDTTSEQDGTTGSADIEDIWTIAVGSRIKF